MLCRRKIKILLKGCYARSREPKVCFLQPVSRSETDSKLLKGDFFLNFFFFLYDIQQCFICHPSDSTVSKDAGIEAKTVAILALTARRCKLVQGMLVGGMCCLGADLPSSWARSHPNRKVYLVQGMLVGGMCCLGADLPSSWARSHPNRKLYLVQGMLVGGMCCLGADRPSSWPNAFRLATVSPSGQSSSTNRSKRSSG